MKKLNLQRFAGGHAVSCLNGGHFTAFSADETSDVQKNATVTLTVTPSSGYELEDIQVVTGGVTIEYGDDSITFKMGEADVILKAFAKKNNLYKIVENTFCSVNGSVTRLERNMMLQTGKNGAITGVSCTGSEITLSADLVAALVESGAIIKI